MNRPISNAVKIVRGLKLSFGIIAAAVMYAAVVTPVLIKIINRHKKETANDYEVTVIDVTPLKQQRS